MTIATTYNEIILGHTIPIESIDDNRIEPFRWLSHSIYDGKSILKINTVDFIVAKLLGRNKRVYTFDRKDSFDVYVFGTFRTYFKPTYKVAEAFAQFYVEIGIMPNLNAVPKHVLMKNVKGYVNRIRGGVLLYERR